MLFADIFQSQDFLFPDPKTHLLYFETPREPAGEEPRPHRGPRPRPRNIHRQDQGPRIRAHCRVHQTEYWLVNTVFSQASIGITRITITRISSLPLLYTIRA